MHRDIVEGHLAHSEWHVTEAESRITRQQELVAELKRRGQDTTEALAILAQFQEFLDLHIRDRDRLRRDLAECSA
jgi:hypothetical protein